MKKLRIRLFELQDGRCAWCGCEMVIDGPLRKNNLLTLDHLYSKLDPRRQSDSTAVAACCECNQRRRVADERKFPETHRERQLKRSIELSVKGDASPDNGSAIKMT